MTEYMKIKNAILRNFADCVAAHGLKEEYTEEDAKQYVVPTTPKGAARMAYENAVMAIYNTNAANYQLIDKAVNLKTVSARQRKRLVIIAMQGEHDSLKELRNQLDNIIYDNDYYNYEYSRN